MYIIVGLGNPGEEYARTRHNTGRMVAEFIAGKVSNIKIITPDTFMNKSGSAVAKVIKNKKAAQKLIVIYDDLDLPLGSLKISYNRSSGGHKGLESIIKALKTREFIRIRIGIGKKGDVEKHILGEFKKPELETLKKVFKCTSEAVQMIVEDGLERAMNKFNQ
ncbi:MAG: Peptidyl-tRNA hydrolase [Parcubacteria group bacterium GW2011_GWD1_44_9]|nr:MAG: Peptidyl-tRNA hydrolase [Parcubacteria group bacterium GW2011_GWD1_44_9]